MIKYYLLFIFIFFSISSYSQKSGISLNGENCLFGYISESSDEYNQVIDYLNNIGIAVLSTCEDERLIYVQLNYKYKDYTDLFALIEKRFMGTCYYKSLENKIPRYNKCRGQYIKEIAEK